MDGGRTRLLCTDGLPGAPVPRPMRLPTPAPDALAFIQYTSGSTMAPRGWGGDGRFTDAAARRATG